MKTSFAVLILIFGLLLLGLAAYLHFSYNSSTFVWWIPFPVLAGFIFLGIGMWGLLKKKTNVLTNDDDDNAPLPSALSKEFGGDVDEIRTFYSS